MPKRVVIVGGGIAGLSAAYYLRKGGDCEITLFEADDRLGGKIGTYRSDSLLVERGPDSIFTMKPAGLDLMTELGLEDQFIGPQASEFSIFVDGKLHGVPRALASLISVAGPALEKVGFLTAAAKRRVLAEKEQPRGSGDDESIASFFRRRFGTKFSTSLAEPLLAGIHAGNPEKLSMKALYPTFLGMEQKQGSLSASNGSAPAGASHAQKKPAFIALAGGMESLVERLLEKTPGIVIHRNVPVTRIESAGPGLTVCSLGQHPLQADAIIIAAPSYAAARMLSELAPSTADALNEVRHVSTAVVSLAYPRSAFKKELHGNGFLVPYTEPSHITGCTWSSNKWEGRADDDTILMRVFVGKDGDSLDGLSDEEVRVMAQGEVERILQPRAQPSFLQIDRWPRAMPQYELGHLERMERAEQGLIGLPIYLVGASYRGSGIPDCVRQGRLAAEVILDRRTN